MLKINVGFNRKVGEANYGSRGASVNLELELDSSLVGEPDRLRDRVRQLFLLAKSSVDEELNHQADQQGANGNGAAVSSRVRNGSRHRRDNTRRATASQVRAIHAIADRQQLDVAVLLQERYGIQEAAELSITEASQLIDELKAEANGQQPGERR